MSGVCNDGMDLVSSEIQRRLAKTSSQDHLSPLWKSALDSKERRLNIGVPRETASPHESKANDAIKDEMVR